VVSWPEGYELDGVEPTPDTQRERAVVWRGPTTFGPGGPQLTLSQQPLAGTSPVPIAAAAGVAVSPRAPGPSGVASERPPLPWRDCWTTAVGATTPNS